MSSLRRALSAMGHGEVSGQRIAILAVIDSGPITVSQPCGQESSISVMIEGSILSAVPKCTHNTRPPQHLAFFGFGQEYKSRDGQNTRNEDLQFFISAVVLIDSYEKILFHCDKGEKNIQ